MQGLSLTQNKMAHTAINIVLIPPPELMQAVIAFNSSLAPQEGYLHFEPQNAVPHISLAMTVVHDAPLLNLIGEIISTGSAFPFVTLALESHTILKEGNEMPLNWLKFQQDRLLTKMHHKMMEVIEGHQVLNFGNNSFSLLPNEVMPEGNIDYVKNYIPTSLSENNFNPHITLGFGEGQNSFLPNVNHSFTFTKMGLYQLGPHCSCREEIAIFDLAG